jgi:riboflavin biosynthesis pyrimidine reductase
MFWLCGKYRFNMRPQSQLQQRVHVRIVIDRRIRVHTVAHGLFEATVQRIRLIADQ